MTTLYQDLVSLGVTIENHYSDLDFPDTPQTREVLRKHLLSLIERKRRGRWGPRYETVQGAFWNRITGTVWIRVPFAFDPFWSNI